MLDEQLAQEIKNTQRQWLAEGKLPTPDKLREYYTNFRIHFEPEALSRISDSELLLEVMHGSGYSDSMVYWLEFKNDEEFPAIFGSISGGSALKFGVYRSSETGLWMARDARNYPTPISDEKAIEIARKHRDQLIKGAKLLEQFPANATDDDYRALQAQLDTEAPDVSRLAWGHKYFSLLYPDKLEDIHVENYQRFHLIKLLQLPPEEAGRYVCAGRYVALAHELDMPLNHLTAILYQRNGRPYKYWRIGTSAYEQQEDFWPLMRDGNCVAIGWKAIGDLSQFLRADDLVEHVRQKFSEYYPNTPAVITRKANEIKRFVNPTNSSDYLSVGDLALAADGATILGIGRVVGEYEYVADDEFPHHRPVEWLSLEKWKEPQQEGLRTTVWELKKHPENLLEAERRIFGSRGVRTPGEGPQPLVPVKLSGIPARVQAILERKGQVILYGPPGTGKTYWADIAARELAALSAFSRPFEELNPDQQKKITRHYVRLCSFHPGYGYEDFLEGYRAEVLNGQMTFVRRDGIFKQLCDDAHVDPQHNFYLIIDEINRGDVPRIFGELLTVLERDKRGKDVLLPLNNTSFKVPKNVYLIGTMNTADRSIALLDTALRRRFGFFELMPDYDVLRDALVGGIPLAPWLEALNRRILEHVSRDARNLQIGHAYLLDGGKPVSSFAKFSRVVEEDIIPLLEEYCYEDYTTLEKILGKGLVNVVTQEIKHDLFDPARQDELVQALLAPSPEITTSLQAAVSEEPEPDEDEEDNNTHEDE
jgi:5-methylcytosine-specific restriction protein B